MLKSADSVLCDAARAEGLAAVNPSEFKVKEIVKGIANDQPTN